MHSNDSDTTVGSLRPTEPHNTDGVHLVIQHDTPGEASKLYHAVNIGRLPVRLLVGVFKVDSGAAHREESGCWRGGDSKNLRNVGDPDPEA